MRTLRFAVCVFLLSLLCSGTFAYTLTFDDIPQGESWDNYYSNQYNIMFDGLYLLDHASSSWGPPHSGSNVLFSDAADWSKLTLKGPYPSDLYATSISAYFSTQQSVVINMELWGESITSVQIGAPGESWNNRYIVLASATPFNQVVFRPVDYNGLGFSLDDMTITPVPEPSSLAALTLALFSAAGAAVARRRRG